MELLLDQNSEQRETLTKLMAQGYIDQILYNQETNALLLQAETYRSDIEAITICMTGDSAKVTEANLLVHFVSHADMLTNYSEELFESYADHIEISGRNEIKFVMKCGLRAKFLSPSWHLWPSRNRKSHLSRIFRRSQYG